MKKYRVCDLSKGMFGEDTNIEANSPLEAGKKYLKLIGDKGNITRDLFNRGRLVIVGVKGSYVYNVE